MQVRILVPDDAAAFQALRLQGLLECPSAFASSHEEEVATPIATVAQRLAAQPDRATFGAFDGEALVGVLGLQREAMRKLAHKATLWGMYVAPRARRDGVGARLVGAALAHASRPMGVRQVTLGVNAANPAALALYRRLGFEAFGLEPGFLQVEGELHDEVHMLRVLTA
ncbi:MAG: GNAT family N-acetyltransferase [Pseudomonadota bacterium]